MGQVAGITGDMMGKHAGKRGRNGFHLSSIPNPIPMPGPVDEETRQQRINDLREYFILGMLAVMVGIIVGLGAGAFRYLMNLFHNIMFLGRIGYTFNAYEYMDLGIGWLEGSMVWLVVLIPAVGGLLAGYLVKYGAEEAKGHGVPEVMTAVVKEGGRIRPRVGLVKAVASAITIGSGGSAGREGPMIQIGASSGSSLAQFLHLSDEKTRILVGVGASAGIAATFNAPIAGVVFSLELILLEFKTKSFVPLVIGSVIATLIAYLFMGNEIALPIKDIADLYVLRSPYELLLYLVLGLIAGLASLFFVRFFYNIEDMFESLRFPEHLKPMLGGLLLGVVGLALYWQFDHFYIFGVGYGAVMPVITSSSGLAYSGVSLMLFLLLLMFMKMLATSLTLGSGASGGVFAPSLWMGAMLGGAFGIGVNLLFPGIAAPYGAYALVGMAAFFSGASRATLTSIIILFEMTSTYEIILPLMFSCVIADAVSRVLSRDTIYTMKLRKKGVLFSYDREVNVLETVLVREAMIRNVACVTERMTLEDVSGKILATGYQGFPCIDSEGKLCGIVTHKDVKDALLKGAEASTPASQIMTHGDLVVAYPDETLEDAMEKMAAGGFGHLPVVDRDDPQRLVGFLTREDIIRVHRKKLEERKDHL